ncbi:MAG: glycine dehydrogenase (aminomethyl-transferring), partial [Prochlorococcus sp.]|nr:glycine dehydrogenase (aminomethyl-transferring) [Prochlorococcus sp.]
MNVLAKPFVHSAHQELSGFVSRHIGPGSEDQQRMLQELGYQDLEAFIRAVVPPEILDDSSVRYALSEGCGEAQALEELRAIAAQNLLRRSLIGLGYHGTATPAVIQRHIFENPAWYTAYTPYQAEISQGRLEALFNFQTLISELTGLPIANASLLDEGTAAAEAMSLSFSVCKRSEARRFLVDAEVLPQTLAVLQTRAEPLGIHVEVAE